MTEFKVSKSVSLPICEEPNEYIPADLPYYGNKTLLEQIAVAVNMNKPVLLSGETGTGKTSVLRHLAAKTNNGFRRLNLNGGTGTDELLGKFMLNKEGTYWIDGVLVEGMKKGYWVLLDEINAASAEVLFALHSLLDDDGYIVLAEHGGEIVRPHPNFRMFASMNPSHDYVGAREMNKALMSRFIVVKTDFPTEATESTILQHRGGVGKTVATRMLAFTKEIRSMYKAGKIQFVLSTRELLQWSNFFHHYGKYTLSAEPTILNKVGEEDLQSIQDLLSLHFKKIDDPKGIEGAVKVEDDKIKVGDKVKIINDSGYIYTGVGSIGTVLGFIAERGDEKVNVEWHSYIGAKTTEVGRHYPVKIADVEKVKE